MTETQQRERERELNVAAETAEWLFFIPSCINPNVARSASVFVNVTETKRSISEQKAKRNRWWRPGEGPAYGLGPISPGFFFFCIAFVS